MEQKTKVKKGILVIWMMALVMAFSGLPVGPFAATEVQAANKMNTTSITINCDGTKTLKIKGSSNNKIALKINNKKTKVTIKWKSSKPAVAKVSAEAKVVAAGAGTTTITAYYISKGKNTVLGKCKVTVVHAGMHLTKTVKASKTGEGYDVYTCSGCGATKKTNFVDYSPSAEQVYKDILALKSEYPEGMRWTNDNYYGWKGGIYSGGYGCAGFAMRLSDEAFGDLPARKYTDKSQVRVGDIIRVNNDTHSVIVLEVNGDGTVIVAEGNYNESVHWGRQVDLSSCGFVYGMTRYPK